LEKIRACAAFVADVTLVGSIEPGDGSGERKRTPNPNVLIELGYAVGTLGWERTILVMNTLYGPPEDLPFDLRHRRWPLRFSAKPDDALNSVRSKLSAEIETALPLILSQRGAADSGAIADEVRQKVESFHAAVKAGKFADINASHGVLAVSIIPTQGPADPSSFLQTVAGSRTGPRPLCSSGWNHRLGGRFFRTFDTRGPDDASATEVGIDGVTLAVTNRNFAEKPAKTSSTSLIEPDMIGVVPVKGAATYLNVLQQTGLRGACWLALALLNLRPCRLRPHSWLGDSQVCEGDVVTDPVRFEIGNDAVTLDDVARALRLALDHFWREFEQINCPEFDQSGNWKGPR
jgi:hypothetical protein